MYIGFGDVIDADDPAEYTRLQLSRSEFDDLIGSMFDFSIRYLKTSQAIAFLEI
jgi:hypothetical protein